MLFTLTWLWASASICLFGGKSNDLLSLWARCDSSWAGDMANKVELVFSFTWMEALSCAVSQEDLELHLRPHFHGLGWVGWGLWLITALQHVLNSVMHGHHQGVTNSETKGH